MYWLNEPTDSIITTILKSSRDWKERNIILLGDVAYTRTGLEKIFSSEISFGMVANPRIKPHERYALMFDREKEVEVKNACLRALALGALSGNQDVKLVNICASQIDNRIVRFLVTAPPPMVSASFHRLLDVPYPATILLSLVLPSKG